MKSDKSSIVEKVWRIINVAHNIYATLRYYSHDLPQTKHMLYLSEGGHKTKESKPQEHFVHSVYCAIYNLTTIHGNPNPKLLCTKPLVVPWETGEGDLSTLLPSPPVHPDSSVKNVKQQLSLVHKSPSPSSRATAGKKTLPASSFTLCPHPVAERGEKGRVRGCNLTEVLSGS